MLHGHTLLMQRNPSLTLHRLLCIRHTWLGHENHEDNNTSERFENVLMGLRDSCSSLIECSFCRDGNQTMLSVGDKPSAVRILILRSKSVSWWLSLCISCKPVAWIEISLLFSYWRIGLNGFVSEFICTSEFLCLEMVFNVQRDCSNYFFL